MGVYPVNPIRADSTLVDEDGLLTILHGYNVGVEGQAKGDFIRLVLENSERKLHCQFLLNAASFGAAVVGTQDCKGVLRTWQPKVEIVPDPPVHAATGMTELQRTEYLLRLAMSVIDGFVQVSSMNENELVAADIDPDWWQNDYNEIAMFVNNVMDKNAA